MAEPDRRRTRRCARVTGGERGASNATFVILFPVLLVMFMGLVQWGLWFHAQALVDAAAQDGGQVARDAGGTSDDGRAVAQQLLDDATTTGLLHDVTIDITDQGGTVEAVVTGQVRAIVPLPGLNLTVRGHSVGPREQFVAEDER